MVQSRLRIMSCLLLLVSLSLSAHPHEGKALPRDQFLEFIRDLQGHLSSADAVSTIPTDAELRDWDDILTALRSDSVVRCRELLLKYNYTLSEISDPVTGSDYLVVQENYPLQRGWGTYLYNLNRKKRLFVHVQYPVTEFNTLQIGADLFRRLDGEMLFISGPQKSAVDKWDRKAGRLRKSVFTRWHELVTDLVHLTVSVRAIPGKVSNPPDVVVSNGRTADEQWGISQISLTLRDSLRSSGFHSVLAMFDSGYAALAGVSSREGIFSNDSVGFGHWLGICISPAVRANPALARRMVLATGAALAVTGKRISQQVNRAFGLVTPRVVRIDSLHGMMFPPSSGADYRIVSFRAGDQGGDSLPSRMGSWIDLGRSGSMTSVTSLDSGAAPFGGKSQKQRLRHSGSAVVQNPASFFPASVSLGSPTGADTDRSAEKEPGTHEPIQVHRIPLEQVPVPEYAPQIAQHATPFSISGVPEMASGQRSALFQINGSPAADGDASSDVLVPLINCRFETEDEQYIGLRLNAQLVDEISRLVARHGFSLKDVELTAEQQADGGYCLRLIPHQSLPKPAREEIAHRF